MRFSLDDRSSSVEFEDIVHLTFEALARVPEFRKARGRQHDLKGVLALIIVGLASGHHSFAAIAAFGKRREDDLIPLLGLPRAPSHKTVWRIAKGVDAEAIRSVLKEIGGAVLEGRRKLAVAIDGKVMRSSRNVAGKQVQVVMAVEHSTGVVIDAAEVPGGGSEKVVGRQMMRELAKSPKVAVLTGDALYADRPTARAVEKAGADYVFKLKGGASPTFSTT